ncbi:uncharacterized protein I303_106513 [Kwoniella dejecticola CBS 10117]|uniref:Uncharacterized protein n=1 Tax=Kwoniella dejecticola CBS 10117 TaxID=1296121 RepID=A0A1A5ZUH5_9TREE|nr:uncharacterized protein I303_08229 [Kwoniella dejecticola CBS 10117]OBR81459.1 hypothetical protein I303_08229 [Kwoniella dejecticola CBS 10117]
MLSAILLSLMGANAGIHVAAAPALTARQAESHQVTMVNNCGSGEAVFVHEGNHSPSGSSAISGPLKGGLAWMSGIDGVACGDNGLNCGLVEFTLINSQDGMQNSADYSLLDGVDDELGTSLGNHQFQYSMDFTFDGCTPFHANSPCTGDSAEACPGGFLDSATEGGAPVQCLADNVGITITFCSSGGPQPNDAADPANPAEGSPVSAPPSGAPSDSAPIAGSSAVPTGAASASAGYQPGDTAVVPPAAGLSTSMNPAVPSVPADSAASLPASMPPSGTKAAITSFGTAPSAAPGAVDSATLPPPAGPFGSQAVQPNGAGSVAEGGPSIATVPSVSPVAPVGAVATSVPWSETASQKLNWAINYAWTRGFD